jgi:uncharacterized small protein (DUF1192 family)
MESDLRKDEVLMYSQAAINARNAKLEAEIAELEKQVEAEKAGLK